MSDDKLTIFNADITKEYNEAVKNFIAGTTPREQVKRRDARGGGKVPYVTGAYMTRQAGLLTGFKWSHEVLSKRTMPDWWKVLELVSKETYTQDEVKDLLTRIIRLVPREIIVDVKVTLYDNDGNAYSHTATGQKDVAYQRNTNTPMCLGDDEKAAETDGIKKALSYWGIANDVYGNELKELEAYMDSKEVKGKTIS